MPGPHVLVVIDSLDPNGAETYAVQVVNSLAARGVPVTLAAGWHNGNGLDATVRPDVRRLALPWRWHRSKAKQARSLWASSGALAQVARRDGVEVVQTLLPTTMIAGFAAARRAGVAIAHTQMHVSSVAGRADRAVSRLLLPRMDLVVALGTYLHADLVEGFGSLADRTVVCRLGVDVDHFTPAGRSAARSALGLPDSLPTVGICTSLRPLKDPMLALRAFAVFRRHREAAFIVVGDGEMRGEMEAFAAAEGIAADVRFTGHLTDVREAVPAFDVYLETCNGPNLGLAPLETLAMGIPLIVATRTPDEVRMAQDTLVDGSAGVLASAAITPLADALVAFFDRSPEQQAVTAAAARATALEHYRWEGHVDGLLALYRSIARAPTRRRDLV